jgi:hypothetical protein
VVDLAVGCHLSIYVILDWANLSSCFVCSLTMYVCRLHIAHVWVPVGTMSSYYGVVWVVGILGVLADLSKRAASFAS